MFKKSKFPMRAGITFFVCLILIGYVKIASGYDSSTAVFFAVGSIGGIIWWFVCAVASFSNETKYRNFISLSVLDENMHGSVFEKEVNKGKLFKNRVILGAYKYRFTPYDDSTDYCGYLLETSEGWFYAFESSYIDNRILRKDILDSDEAYELYPDVSKKNTEIQFKKINTLMETVIPKIHTRKILQEYEKIPAVRINVDNMKLRQLKQGSKIKKLCKEKFSGIWKAESFYMSLKEFEKKMS